MCCNEVKALVEKCDKDKLGKAVGIGALAIAFLGGAIYIATKIKKD